jgi:hypothetical protein
MKINFKLKKVKKFQDLRLHCIELEFKLICNKINARKIHMRIFNILYIYKFL